MCSHRAHDVSDAASALALVEPLEPRLLLSAVLESQALSQAEDTSLPVLVPAVVEAESDGGGTNNVVADAEVLEFQHVLGEDGPGPLQAVVTGTADGWGGPAALYEDSAMVFGAVAAPNVYTLRMTDAIAPGGDGLVTITASADLDAMDEFLTLSAEGVVLGDVFVADGANFTAVSAQVTLPAAHLAAMAADGVVELTVTPSAAVEREQSGYLLVELTYAGGGGAGTADYYAMDLQAGEVVSLAADGAVNLQLVDGEGTVLAEGDVAGYVARQEGPCYVRITGEGPYTLVANRGGAMDVEDNDTLASAQPITGGQTQGRQWVVGRLAGEADSDVYSVSLSRRPLKVRLDLPAGPANVTVRLLDAAGNVVATGRQLPHGTVMLTGKAPRRAAGGEYFIEVTTEADVQVDYVLAVWR